MTLNSTQKQKHYNENGYTYSLKPLAAHSISGLINEFTELTECLQSFH